MFAVIPEDHDSSNKRKPRLLQSQDACTGIKSGLLRLTATKPKLNNISFTPVSLLDYRRVAKTLALSFDKDPFVNYILNTQIEYEPHQTRQIKKKQDLMLSLFEFSVYECISVGGLVLAVKDNNLELELIQQRLKALAIAKVPFLGVACWNKLGYDEELESFDYPMELSTLKNIHPSSLKYNLFSSLAKCRQKVNKIGVHLLTEARDSVLEGMVSAADLQIADNVWYLADVGILPSMQGHGLAKKLINHCLENYMVGNWCYLESSNRANRGFYEKLGWRLMKTYLINESESSGSDSESFESGSPVSTKGMFFRKPKRTPANEEILTMDAFVLYAEAKE